MAPSSITSSLLFLLSVLLPAAVVTAAATPPAPGAAFNVTEILSRYPEFKLFNFLLSKTGVAREVNSRSSVTVLVPDNSAVDWLLRRSARLPRAALVELVSVHVLLDYIDVARLAALPARGQPTVVTTLFQTTGTALNRTGFLNVTSTGSRGGNISAIFVSAAPGSLVSATFKRAVTARPYNISVLQISNFVLPPGIISKPRLLPSPPTPLAPRSPPTPPAPRSPPKPPAPRSPPTPPAPRMRQMALVPSPAPSPLTLPRVSPITIPTTSEGDTAEAPDTAKAPAPSRGHVARVTSWWIGAAAVGMACMLGYL